jgi:putative ABC transport system substrate-binding protein
VVHSRSAAPYAAAEQAFRKRLAGRGFAITSRTLADLAKSETLPRADAFLAVGTSAAAWLHPRVRPPTRLAYCLVSDPTEAGIPAGSGHVGLSTDGPVADQFDLIAEALPETRSVGLLYRSGSARSRRMLAAARAALPTGWGLRAVDIDASDSVSQAVSSLLAREPDVIWIYLDRNVHDTATVHELLTKGMVKRRIPVFGYSARVVKAGALVGTDIRPEDQGHQAGALVESLLRHKPDAPPPAPPRPRFRVAVNLHAARILGVDLPRSLLRRASIVVGRD